MAGLLSEARPLDWLRGLLAPDPGWQYSPGLVPMKSRTPLDPIYGAPQIMQTEFRPAIPGMAREMAGSLLNVLEAPVTGVMPTPADLLNVTPMLGAPGLLAKIPAGALASGVARRAAAPEPAARSPLGFYSPTEQAVLNLKQKTLTPDQARASLANLGAKPEEMQWMGVDEFLAARPSVTQDELLDFVRQNRVNVQQVTYGGPDPEALVRQADELMLQGQRVQASGDLDAARVLFGQHDDLMRRAEGIEASPQGLLAPKYSEYSLPGGENYREVVLVLTMASGRAKTAQNLNARIRAIDTKLNNVGDMSRYDNLRPDMRARVYAQRETWASKMRQERAALIAEREALGNVPDYRGGHFEDPNVLAHVRMNDRIDADGKKVLFIEEIQSDWHQKGRRGGYANPERLGELKSQRAGILEKRDAVRPDWQDRYEQLRGARERAYPDVGKITGAEESEWKFLRQKKAEFEAETASLLAGVDSEIASLLGTVPDAPFKKTWSDLAMKRVMQMAAEEGYDRVAWTTGRMQADRYDLSKQISEIHYSGSNLKAYDHDGATVISRTGVKESDLPDLIGKEAADRLLAQKSNGTWRRLVGQDLQVGGEGMISFYDKMLPKKAQKIARRLDKDAKVGRTQLHYDERLTTAEEVWSIDITPAMRKTVRTGGQPLFANPATVAAPGLLSTQQPAPPPSMIMDSRQRIPRGLLDAAA